MLVYNDVKRQFVLDVKDNSIADKILDAIKANCLNAGHDMQYSVRTYVADARRIVPHPSYQALREYLKRCIKN